MSTATKEATIRWQEIRTRPKGGTQEAPWCQIEVELRARKDGYSLSVCGTLGAVPNQGFDKFKCVDGVTRNAGGGGQCVDDLRAFFPEYAHHFEHHLNDMHAGCEHQRAEGWDKRPIDPSKPLNTYGKHFPGQKSDSWNMLGWVTRKEHPEGLLSHPCPTCGYKYGSAWKRAELPAETLEWAQHGQPLPPLPRPT